MTSIRNEKDPKLCSISNKDLLGDSVGILTKKGEKVKWKNAKAYKKSLFLKVDYSGLKEYRENILFSKSFYAPLSILEVSLKNSLDDHFIKTIGADWLFNKSFIKAQLQIKIDNAIKILNQNNKQTIKSQQSSIWT